MFYQAGFAVSPQHSESESRRQRSVISRQVLRVQQGTGLDQRDWLAAEEPLEIRVASPGQEAVRVTVTMRTPGHDRELAVGFLYAEGLIRSCADLGTVSVEATAWDIQPCNVVTVHLTQPVDLAPLQRHFLATSSCGVCGKASLEQIAVRCPPVLPGPVLPGAVLVGLPSLLRQAQRLFAQTGGLHASGLFDVTGQLLALQEDVGRHNALDKLVGQQVLAGEVPLIERIILVSGRTSFELLQKAAMAGVPIVCAVSAPSSLAVEVAQRFGITLVGFLREQSFNIYTHPERIAIDC